MAQLMSSGGKGINNPLAKLSNQFSTDRGAQGDLYPNARAGPSRQTHFRSTPQQGRPIDPTAGPSSSSARAASGGAFDVSALAHALQVGGPTPSPDTQGWVASYLHHQQGHSGQLGETERQEMSRIYERVQQGPHSGIDWRGDFLRFERENAAALRLGPDQVQALDRAYQDAARMPPWNHPLPPAHFPYQQPAFVPRQHYPQHQNPATTPSDALQDAPSHPQQQQQPHPDVATTSLSETASILLNHVDGNASTASAEESVKFQNSAFMGLMRSFADGTADVQGEDVIATQPKQVSRSTAREGEEGWAQSFSEDNPILESPSSFGEDIRMQPVSDVKGKGRATEPGSWASEFGQAQAREFDSQQQESSAPTHHHQEHQGYHPLHSAFGRFLPIQQQFVAPSAGAASAQQSARTVDDWEAQFLAQEKALAAPGKEEAAGREKEEDPYTTLSDAQLQADTARVGASSAWEETLGFDEEEGDLGDEDAFLFYNGAPRSTVGAAERVKGEQERERERMMDEWEEIPGQSTMKSAAQYVFQTGNPWTDERWAQGQAGSGGDLLQGVLEQEAIVLKNPSDAEAWFELGVRQQENEREAQAIIALTKSTSIAPELAAPHLALAVSHTNNNDRISTFSALEAWVAAVSAAPSAPAEYARVLANHEGRPRKDESTKARHEWLVGVLVDMARAGGDQVDAEVQIALGVLFNTSGEYGRAQDCFRTALAVRPEDWQLYNRLGATLANGGRAEEAHNFYWRALELQPGFVRARFNLGISCINLRRYEEAASHIVTALRLQQNDSTEDLPGHAKGVGSAALWETLRNTCSYMHRPDLVELCIKWDLDGFDGVSEEWEMKLHEQMVGEPGEVVEGFGW